MPISYSYTEHHLPERKIMNQHTYYNMQNIDKAIKADAAKDVPQFPINQKKPTAGQLLAKKFDKKSK